MTLLSVNQAKGFAGDGERYAEVIRDMFALDGEAIVGGCSEQPYELDRMVSQPRATRA